ncbi:MAG: hypothetical protein M3P51_18320 [Chloroflexota bacterium]|nr:hypothetical protein [Chloroflexota bacterium]
MCTTPVQPVARTLRTLGVLVGVSVAGALAPLSLAGQTTATGPSYQETTGYLAERITPTNTQYVHQSGTRESTYTNTWGGANGCTIMIEEEIESIDNDRADPSDTYTTTVFTIDLTRQDPSFLDLNVDSEPPLIPIDNDAIIRSRTSRQTNRGSGNYSDREGARMLHIRVADTAVARRLARALQHLTRMCGGKAPSKPKDLFDPPGGGPRQVP